MKCVNCGAPLKEKEDKYFCEFCGEVFQKEEVSVKEQNVNIKVNVQANEFVISGGVLKAYKGNAKQVIIPNGVVLIGDNAFKNNLSVCTVVFSDSLESVGKGAFDGCVNLTSVLGYQNVKKFDDECFRASGLKNIVIGENVEYLGRYCFSNMPKLEKVVYKPGKNLMLKNTFAYCKNLSDVDMDQLYFFSSFNISLAVKNNPKNVRATYGDAFVGTPFLKEVKKEMTRLYEQCICPECGGKIKKGLFHARCVDCGFDFIN